MPRLRCLLQVADFSAITEYRVFVELLARIPIRPKPDGPWNAQDAPSGYSIENGIVANGYCTLRPSFALRGEFGCTQSLFPSRIAQGS
jgi:hypothetical protein